MKLQMKNIFIKKSNLKENKAITLVSLVITIVIMLILAGVSISFVVGQNGLFTKSKQSAETYKVSSDIEKIKNAWNEYVTDSTERDYTEELTLAAFNTYVTDNNVLDVVKEEENKLNIKVNDNYYEVKKVDSGIEVTKIEKIVDETPSESNPVDPNKIYAFNRGSKIEDWDIDNPTRYCDANPELVKNSGDCIEFLCANRGSTPEGLAVNSKVSYDLTNYTKLHMKYDIELATGNDVNHSYLRFQVAPTQLSSNWNDVPWYNTITYVTDNGSSIAKQNQELVIDVTSLNGQYYINLQDCSIKCKIYEIWFE